MVFPQTPRPDPYCGPAPTPDTWLAAWNLDPVLLMVLAVAGLAGWAYLHKSQADGMRRAAWMVAVACGVLAFVSPLCAMTVALFSARGVHHLVLIGVLAPALAVALPLRAVTDRLGAGAALGTLSVALWAWHLPPFYALAWDHATIYWALQIAVILPAWAFWSAALSPSARIGGTLMSGLAVAGLAGQMGLIGAILTFAPRSLYPEHLTTTDAFGLTPLADQQLAGLVMWVPGMVPMALVAGWMLRAAWHREAARDRVQA